MTSKAVPAAVVREGVHAVASSAVRAFGEVDLVILPIGRDDKGRGLYPGDTVFLGKNLRAAGYRVAYADPPGRRLFDVRKSAVAAAVVGVALGLLTNAAWDGVKWLAGRIRRSSQSDESPPQLEIQITDARSDSSSTTWTIRGEPTAVTAAIERLRPTPAATLPSAHDDALPIPSPGFVKTGPSDDLLDAHHRQEIDSRLGNARSHIIAAQSALVTDAGDTTAEVEARDALSAYASALNWAEDTDLEEAVHNEMDGAGAWVRRTFGCAVAREGSEYFQRCPVALAHTRVGLSVGGYARKRCSLCGDDLSECPHFPGVAYLVPGGPDNLGWCRICLREEGCEHASDQMYRASVVSTIVEMALEEVSIVAKPAQPDARISSISMSVGELQQALGDRFVAGLDVSCNRCLSACAGLHRIQS
ncbi:MAG: hypothetical protein SXG53_24835 [Pseudomonadota bacterium]|nr:hypothetical protein [Pseudomonadota bacterium]